VSRYWIGVASHEHVRWGVSGGYAQLGHGKAGGLRRLAAGDGLIYYSPKEVFGPEGVPCQSFTAIGFVSDDEVFPFDMGNGFVPFRRRVAYIPHFEEAPIKPLIAHLSFIKNPAAWGSVFRFGQLEIPQIDFERIASAMGVANVHG